MARAGFAAPQAAARKVKKKPVKKVKTQQAVEHAQTFCNLPGEVAIALESALMEMKLEFHEVPTIRHNAFGEQQIPFIRHNVKRPGGGVFTIGCGTYQVAGLGRVEMQASPYEPLEASVILWPLEEGEWDQAVWDDLLVKIEDEIQKVTAFRGHAIRLSESKDCLIPRYLDVKAHVNLIFNPEVEHQLDISLFRIIRHREALHRAGVRIKRGVVMEGQYGTGKTSVALMAAKVAVENGMTFISVPATLAKTGYKVAMMMQPSVIFVEDLDASTHGDRDRLNSVLDTLSGIESKESQVILLVSTNFLERIDRAFLRPERLDTIIKLVPPTRGTVARLITAYAGDLLEEGDYAEVHQHLTGATPAIIGEAVMLSKIAAVTDGRKITATDLMIAARGLQRQRELAEPVFKEATQADKLAEGLGGVIKEALD